MTQLYAFYPHVHGPRSFFVMATTQAEAISMVRAKLKKEGIADEWDDYGWIGNPGRWEIVTAEFGEVLDNDND